MSSDYVIISNLTAPLLYVRWKNSRYEFLKNFVMFKQNVGFLRNTEL